MKEVQFEKYLTEAAFTKQHFTAIADIIVKVAKNQNRNVGMELMDEFSRYFKSQNSLFNAETFKKYIQNSLDNE